MSRLLERLGEELHTWERAGRRRQLAEPDADNFISNDYLGLSRHPAIRTAVAEGLNRGLPLGSTGSRLLSGERTEHRRAEESFARFVDREAALLFSSGFAANLALLSTIPGRRDLILYDSAVHASLKEGALGGFAARRAFRHNDVEELRKKLADREKYRDLFVVVEGVYSMDGDTAPLPMIDQLTRAHDAHLIVDEAHATGLLGPNLRGAVEAAGVPTPFATVHPCGKGLGLAGGFIAADQVVIDYLINAARPFIFSTAPSPILSVALERAVSLLPSMKGVAASVLRNADLLREELRRMERWSVPPGESPIVPVIIGDNNVASSAAEWLRDRGFDLRAIRPPTVPEGTARLRITLTADHSEEIARRLAEAIVQCEKEFG